MRPAFDFKKGAKEYHWKTIIEFKRVFERKAKEDLPGSPENPPGLSILSKAIATMGYPLKKELKSEFVVNWKVDVSANKRFSKLELIDISFVQQEFLPHVTKSTDED